MLFNYYNNHILIKLTDGKISDTVKWAELAPGVAIKKTSDHNKNWTIMLSISYKNKKDVKNNKIELNPSINESFYIFCKYYM